MIGQVKAFQADLQGYVDVPFKQARSLLPLRRARRWTEAQREAVADLVRQGGGYALQRLVGPDHPEAAGAFGGAELRPEPFGRAELDARLRRFVRNSRNAGWSAEMYASYLAHLESGAEFKDRGRPVPDAFGENYRAGGPAFRRIVREAFEAAALEAADPGPVQDLAAPPAPRAGPDPEARPPTSREPGRKPGAGHPGQSRSRLGGRDAREPDRVLGRS